MPLQNSELLTDMIVEWAASAAATSTIASTYAIGSMPAPPYSVGTSMPIRPFSPNRRMLSSGNSPVRS